MKVNKVPASVFLFLLTSLQLSHAASGNIGNVLVDTRTKIFFDSGIGWSSVSDKLDIGKRTENSSGCVFSSNGMVKSGEMLIVEELAVNHATCERVIRTGTPDPRSLLEIRSLLLKDRRRNGTQDSLKLSTDNASTSGNISIPPSSNPQAGSVSVKFTDGNNPNRLLQGGVLLGFDGLLLASVNVSANWTLPPATSVQGACYISNNQNRSVSSIGVGFSKGLYGWTQISGSSCRGELTEQLVSSNLDGFARYNSVSFYDRSGTKLPANQSCQTFINYNTSFHPDCLGPTGITLSNSVYARAEAVFNNSARIFGAYDCRSGGGLTITFSEILVSASIVSNEKSFNETVSLDGPITGCREYAKKFVIVE